MRQINFDIEKDNVTNDLNSVGKKEYEMMSFMQNKQFADENNINFE